MKLYAIALSPYASRARLALKAKGLAFEQLPPPGGGTRSPEYLAINPVGKLPVLITDDGLTIVESETIVDFLDDRFPQPPLLPTDAAARAQARNAVRTQELYATPALFRLFKQLDPAVRNAAVVDAELEQLRNGLTLLQHFVDDAPFVAGGMLTKADCLVLPNLLLCATIGPMLGIADLIGEFPTLQSYVTQARQHPIMGAEWDETEAALRTQTG